MNLEDDLPYKGSLKKAKNRVKLKVHNPEKLDPDSFGKDWRLMYKHEIHAGYQREVGYFFDNIKVIFTHDGNYSNQKSYFVRKDDQGFRFPRKYKYGISDEKVLKEMKQYKGSCDCYGIRRL